MDTAKPICGDDVHDVYMFPLKFVTLCPCDSCINMLANLGFGDIDKLK